MFQTGLVFKDGKVINHRTLTKIFLNPILRFLFGKAIGSKIINTYMKIKEINNIREMTMRGPSMENQLSTFFKSIADDKNNYDHVGDIEEINVLKNNDVYLLITDNKPVGFYQVIPHDNVAEIKSAYTAPDFRRKGILTNFIWFLKRNEGFSRIRIGDVQSTDTIEAIKRIAKRFNAYWENENGETVPYNVDTIDQFYSDMQPTGWKIVLENDYDFSDWPKFYEIPNIKCLYEGIA